MRERLSQYYYQNSIPQQHDKLIYKSFKENIKKEKSQEKTTKIFYDLFRSNPFQLSLNNTIAPLKFCHTPKLLCCLKRKEKKRRMEQMRVA